jgi:hypothetical protein
MGVNGVSFSIASHTAWAPGITDAGAWAQWASAPHAIDSTDEAPVKQMVPMLRRRAGALGKMALEVAYACLDGRADVPTVFCSRHGDVARAIDLLGELAKAEPLSPTSFGLAVHNASAGLFSIARSDRANHIALAAGSSSVEHAVIEACGLLADGAPAVLLVVYDCPLPAALSQFEDCKEQSFAWAWLMTPAAAAAIHLDWSADDMADTSAPDAMPGALDVLRFHLAGDAQLVRRADRRRWMWRRHA